VLADTYELFWLPWLLFDMGASQSASSPIHCDKRSAIQIGHNDIFHEHTKHIEINCHFIRRHLQHDILHLQLVSSKDQLVGIFTKSHHPRQLSDLIPKLKLVLPSRV